MTDKRPQHNHLSREQELASAGAPKPPPDITKNWSETDFQVFVEFAAGKAFADYSPSDVRLLCRAVDIERMLQDSYDDIARIGTKQVSSNGTEIPNPSVAMIAKLTTTQGSLLRRIGISVDGTTMPRDIAKNARKSRKLQTESGELNSYAQSLLQ